MGGRGGSSGFSAASKTPEYQNAYSIEMETASSFNASFALDSGMTKDAIGYQMYAHQAVTGQSLIVETRKEIDYTKRELRQANQVGKSYGMSPNAIEGMKAGMREKISRMEKAVSVMESARSEYEKYKGQASAGNAKAKRRGGRWM